ncbi:L-serine ammonia-lyase [Estrella lausannensis]|uniref:L-serine dehydratase n=1 Tax=Estrella lausannensis TaxID=483423 RepID=A0A0H5DNY9_9BACT|nr:L-serine ammonia-lyase [Estrella lausannensis]CRX38161.1 L-serine dehydratase [Estrella lausannensis]
MAISIFNLFSIGIGPSSSHTVGPMRAALMFVKELKENQQLSLTEQIVVELYGSLALTGKGHCTDIAVLMGLEGETPEGVDPGSIDVRLEAIRREQRIHLLKHKWIPFAEERNLKFHMDKQLPTHPNGMRFTAYDAAGNEINQHVYYSVGGGFIVKHEEAASKSSVLEEKNHPLPYPFKTAGELLEHCSRENKSIRDIVLANEMTWRSNEEITQGVLKIWDVMKECVERGIEKEGVLPGGLKVRRRARDIYLKLASKSPEASRDPVSFLEWVSLWALAVNEENANGGRVVTAPTNGAAGVIPAVLHYYTRLTDHPTEDGIVTFFLVAGAIGILYKEGASISAAEMGCMGEVGVACSMAAAGLAAALGGSDMQVENAAEIGMEHNLGLTCDPVMGLVQIPCIERNTMGAIKAINASVLALNGDGIHRVSLDHVIATMRETGHNMKHIYKETSLGGLAANVPEC